MHDAIRSCVRVAIGAAAWFLAACGGGGDDPPPGGVQRGEPVRWWTFSEYLPGVEGPNQVGSGTQIGGALLQQHTFGPVIKQFEYPVANSGPMLISDADGTADGQVFGDPSGVTYWAWAQAPNYQRQPPGAVEGNFTELIQYQRFRKVAAGATFKYTVTDAQVLAFDGGGPMTNCDNANAWCDGVLEGSVGIEVLATTVATLAQPTPAVLHHAGGFAYLYGHVKNWTFRAWKARWSQVDFWSDSDFLRDPDVARDSLQEIAFMGLASARTIEIDLSSIPVDGEFQVKSTVRVMTRDRRKRESFLTAFLRDPQSTGGNGIAQETAGLVEVAAPLAQLPPELNGPGEIEFVHERIDATEAGGAAGAAIVVMRSGGSAGSVSVRLTSSDGTARAGEDYLALDTTVAFGDGDAAPRTLRLPFITDTLAEATETVQLQLSAPAGGATLGTRTTMTVGIVDAPYAGTFTLGGTVSGLAGSGLVLHGPFSDFTPAGNGPFVFPEPMRDGLPYDVRIVTQPVNPAQVCSIARGTGAIAGANVTDIAVDCATPPANGALDPSFGSGGTASFAASGASGRAVAIQPDGKLVLAGSSGGNFVVLRWLADGSPDAAFGSNGVVTIDVAGSTDEAFALALQPDGRIVLAGRARVGSGFDFGVVRLLADGTLDTSFGSGGKVTIDFAGGADYAYGVAVQADGKLVVGGHAAMGATGNDFALARLTAGGALDTGFGSGGKVTTSLGGATDLAFALALAADGRIVLAGRAGDNANADVAVVRYLADGRPDAAFGVLGIARADIGGGRDDLANAVHVLADGSVLIAGQVNGVAGAEVLLAKFTGAGTLDLSFGTNGVARTDLVAGADDWANALAVLGDGRVLLAGQRNEGTAADFAVLRYRADGVFDTAFGSGGVVTIDHGGGADAAAALAVQADGKIVVGGTGTRGTTLEFVIVRTLP